MASSMSLSMKFPEHNPAERMDTASDDVPGPVAVEGSYRECSVVPAELRFICRVVIELRGKRTRP